MTDNSPLTSKIEYLFKIIGRYDTYITSTNTKASLVIAWNSIVIGTVLLKYQEIIGSYETAQFARTLIPIILVALGICSATSIVLIINVIFPFLTSTSKPNTGRVLIDESALFFGSVAKLSVAEYEKQIRELTPSSLLSDLTDQAIILAQGLNQKMEWIRKSLIVIVIQLVFVVLLFVLKLLLFF